MNKLADWIRTSGKTRAAFAEEIGVTPGMITRLCNGESGASLRVANRIALATKGEITPVDLEQARATGHEATQ